MSQSEKKIDPYWFIDRYYHASDTRSKKLQGVRVKDVTCKEDGCRYKPDNWCDDPKKAYRSHLKRKHRDLYYRTLSKPFIVHEEDEVDDAPITDDLIRELLNA